MFPCHSFWDLEEQRGRGFLNLSYGGKGKNQPQTKGTFMGYHKKKLRKDLLFQPVVE